MNEEAFRAGFDALYGPISDEDWNDPRYRDIMDLEFRTVATVVVGALTVTPRMAARAAVVWNEHARGSQGAHWNELHESEQVLWIKAATAALAAALDMNDESGD